MSHLKILVCSILLAAAVSASAHVNADHPYSGTQAAGCGRAGGYRSGAGTYGMTRPAYAPQLNSGGYQSQWNTGYGAAQRFNDGHYSAGYNGTSNFREQYSRPQNFGYNGNDRGTVWGRDSYGYGTSNLNRGPETVYDSVHGDYHSAPSQGNRQRYDAYQTGSANQYNGHRANLNYGW